MIACRVARFLDAGTVAAKKLRRGFASVTAAKKQQTVPEVKQIFVRCDAVCFDVDSTVIQEEGIDVLADYCGKGTAVAELTRRAMGGSVLFQDALRMRLELIQPSKQTIEDCIVRRPFRFTPGIQELVAALHSHNKHVYLISGGFRMMIEPIAEKLGIPKGRVIANTILFNEDGSYKSFDPTEFTSRDRGKPAALEWIMNTYGYKSVVMVGDGVTDMQARPPADAFIGFGGVVARKPVEEGADWFIRSFDELLRLLQ